MDPQMIEEWKDHPVTLKLIEALKKEKKHILEYLGQGGIRGPSEDLVQNYNLQIGRIQMLDTIVSLEHISVKQEEHSDEE